MRKVFKTTAHILVATFIVASPLFWQSVSFADPLTTRSVVIGNSTPDIITQHRFNFTINTVNNIGSIEFEYCSNSPLVNTFCDPPPGFSASSATLIAQSGETGFTIDPVSTANRIVISRAPGATSTIPVSYTFSNVENPSMPYSTTYVRIATFASSDGTGPRLDTGGVAFATNSGLSVSGYVPPYLTFCVGVIVALNCSNATGDFLNFGELSEASTKFLTSQFSVATNDPAGYATSVSGSTMTSGNNIIPALGTPTTSNPGTSQFGMNLRSNSSPAVGTNPSGVGTGAIAPSFSNVNQFYFANQTVASSTTSSNFNLYTVSYIVNISESQPAGVYSTTLTYIAVAAF